MPQYLLHYKPYNTNPDFPELLYMICLGKCMRAERNKEGRVQRKCMKQSRKHINNRNENREIINY